MSGVASIVDRVIEAPVVTSFTKVGYHLRKRLDAWTDLDAYDLSGRVVAITGPTSGLGLAAAEQFARLGATLILIARNEDRAKAVQDHLRATSAKAAISYVLADLGNLEVVREAAARIGADHDRLDVLVHNAGALSNERRTTAGGLELTTAVQVVAPFLLTGLLLPRLSSTPGSRVLTTSSGGMYPVGLTVAGLQMDEESYRGTEQYARAKRAQVTLNEKWAERTAGSGIHFHALHPGWADTPGVAASLPGFRRMLGPLLRTPEQGADTLVWLAADDGPPLETSGAFWLDRRIRPIHRFPSTRRTDTPDRRGRLWDWVATAAGWDLD
jgi:NAD(P)-dependent dehydrogenase (short-subunit alcohol dehydrogenase family)